MRNKPPSCTLLLTASETNLELLEQGLANIFFFLANIFYKGPDSKYFQLQLQVHRASVTITQICYYSAKVVYISL